LKTLRAGSAILDTLYAPKDRLLLTLATQFAGLTTAAVGLALCAMEIWKK
jgi:hypothetical protein